MQEHERLLRFPPQPEDREMAEEDEESNPLLDEEASDGEGDESIPPAESGEDVEDEDEEEEEPLVRKR